MTRTPEFITFTGLDNRCNLQRVRTIAGRWPVEFGILYSQARRGHENRYPTQYEIDEMLFDLDGVNLAAHLCGRFARDVVDGLIVDVDSCHDLFRFERLQVNCSVPDIERISVFVQGYGARGIAQVQGHFPDDKHIDWLFDCSGGNGIAPPMWPRHPGDDGRLVGYAGGIGPDNVVDVIHEIDAAGRYWLDMESGVRTDDWMDLNKVEAVCCAVYGDPS